MTVVPGEYRTYRGHLINVIEPDPATIDIYDIARALSHEVRYAGHVIRRICVAEHCCHIHDLVPEPLKLQALLHDSTEAYLRDLPKPIKVLCPDYVLLEDNLWVHLSERFGVPFSTDPLIKEIDVAIRDIERGFVHDIQLPVPSVDGVDMASVVIHGWEWHRAEAEFLDRFRRLVGDDFGRYTSGGR